MSVADFQRKFTHLVVNSVGGRRSPHKICMLLAVLDLARSGSLTQNRVVYGPALLERFNRYFAAVAAPGDHANAYYPYFHLGGALRGGEAPFWHLNPVPGQERALAAMTTARSHDAIRTVIAHATLDDELFALLQIESNIDALGEALAHHWFNRGLEELEAIARAERATAHYERTLRLPGRVDAAVPVPPLPVRTAAFRRVVIENYDYRCAATGSRIVLPGGAAMVEAAHIRPFCDTADDDPCNGLALTPDMHWAMDDLRSPH